MGIIHWFKNDLKKEERVLTRHLISKEIYLFQIIASRMGLNQMNVIGLF